MTYSEAQAANNHAYRVELLRVLRRIAVALEPPGAEPDFCRTPSCEGYADHDGLHYYMIGSDRVTWPEGGRP